MSAGLRGSGSLPPDDWPRFDLAGPGQGLGNGTPPLGSRRAWRPRRAPGIGVGRGGAGNRGRPGKLKVNSKFPLPN